MGALFVFSFTNKSSFEEVDAALSRLSHSSTASGDVCPLVVGTRYGAVSESEVTAADVLRFEAKWNRYETRSLERFACIHSKSRGKSASGKLCTICIDAIGLIARYY